MDDEVDLALAENPGGEPAQLRLRFAQEAGGKTGASHEDGMTDEIARQLRAAGSKIVRDEAALTWMYGGGAVV